MGCQCSKPAAVPPEGNASPTDARTPVPGSSGPTSPVVRVAKGMDYLLHGVCILLVRAGNLENKEVVMVGTGDPYAVVRIGQQEYTTRVIRKELNPVFNERFSFLVPVTPLPPVCTITFFNHDRTASSNEKLGRVLYKLQNRDFTLGSQSHWQSLDGARSGQAKIRAFAVTFTVLQLTVGDVTHTVFVPCEPNAQPFPVVNLLCVSSEKPDQQPHGHLVLNMSKLFSGRTRRNKSHTLKYVRQTGVDHAPKALLPLVVGKLAEDFFDDNGARVSDAMRPDVDPLPAGPIALPASVLAQAADAGKLTATATFVLANAAAEEFQAGLDAIASTAGGASSVAVSGVGAGATTTGTASASAGAGAGTAPPTASVGALTLRTRSLGSAGVVSAATPRSMCSFRAGQAGVGIGLSLLQEAPTVAGQAARLLRDMTAAMDHLLEYGPHPASPFLASPSRRSMRRLSTRYSTTRRSLAATTGVSQHMVPVLSASSLVTEGGSPSAGAGAGGGGGGSGSGSGSNTPGLAAASLAVPIDPGNVVYPSWRYHDLPGDGGAPPSLPATTNIVAAAVSSVAPEAVPDTGPAARLRQLLQRAGNRQCADCGEPESRPLWVVASAGELVCDACADVYRAAGVAGQLHHCLSGHRPWTAEQVAAVSGNPSPASRGDTKAMPAHPSWSARAEFIAAKRGWPSAPPSLVTPSRAPDATSMGLVYVIVVRAEDLESEEPFAYSDPRCVVTLADAVRKTRTIENTHQPRWNESLLAFPWDGQDVLHLQVFDRDTFSDDLAGYALISLCGIPEGLEQTVTVPLLGKLAGTVTLELTFQRGAATGLPSLGSPRAKK